MALYFEVIPLQGVRAGADDYVAKPADEDQLVARANVGAAQDRQTRG